jgi:hypothetical protein
MPKRRQQVGEEELTSGLKGFGSLDEITEHKPRRDSPFRDTREVELAPVPERKPEKVVAMRPPAAEPVAPPSAEQVSASNLVSGAVPTEQQNPIPIDDEAQRELLERARAARERQPTPPVSSRAAVTERQIPNPPIETRPAPKTIEDAAREVRVVEAHEAESDDSPSAPRKADLYSERVTLLMSSDMRDRVEALAKELQRRKTTKSERITSNTVMRVAINFFLERFELHDEDVANNEEELEALVLRQLQ